MSMILLLLKGSDKYSPVSEVGKDRHTITRSCRDVIDAISFRVTPFAKLTRTDIRDIRECHKDRLSGAPLKVPAGNVRKNPRNVSTADDRNVARNARSYKVD